MGLKRCVTSLAFFLCLIAPLAGPASASTAAFAAPASRDAAGLATLKTMSDLQFQQTLREDWPHVRHILTSYAGPALGFLPASISFRGVRDTCLQRQLALPCRIYISDLIRMHQTNMQEAKRNPFLPLGQ